MAVWYDRPGLETMIAEQWLEVSQPYGSVADAQTVKQLYDIGGWSQYVSKHVSRGISHYQRTPEARPKHWSKSGQMWSKFGNWVSLEPVIEELTSSQYSQVRRIAKRYLIAEAARGERWKRVAYLRRSLKSCNRDKSTVQGVSEWITLDLTLRIIHIMLNR